MIPKIIHYCWFGGKALPKEVRKCIESWQKYCPDYQIIEWNENNYDISKIRFMSDAYQAQKYSFVSDVARLDIVYEHGGIYLDTDVEMIRNIDPLLPCQCFLGFEDKNYINTGLGFGAVKGHFFIGKNRDAYLNKIFNLNKIETCVDITSNLLIKQGIKLENIFQEIEISKDIKVKLLPTDYLCPLNYKTGNMKITENTYCIHHYQASWLPLKNKIIHKIKMFLTK